LEKLLKIKDIIAKIINPPLLAETKHFLIKLAENPAEIEEAQRLRFRIFNIEQGKGLESSLKHGIDRDEFDEQCLHLIVVEKKNKTIIGTYRLHLGSIALISKGFYSEQEYHIQGLETIAKSSLELGRSCISPEYRTGAAVALLWAGIATLMNRAGLIYMLGCASLETTDSSVGWALHKYFLHHGKSSKILTATPKNKYILPQGDEYKIAEYLRHPQELQKHIPPLFKGYLRAGCEICGEPALDTEFGTIDFLIIVNKESTPERYKRHFNIHSPQ
jgi:putative hemolysin